MVAFSLFELIVVVIGTVSSSLFIAVMNFYYQKNCFMRPVVPSIIFGGAFTAISVVQGFPLTPHLAMLNIGGLYTYQALQCPMVAIHRRESAIHNTLSGAILGYIGVKSFGLGVPFVDGHFFYRNPQVSPAIAGAIVYGSIGAALAMLNGKPF